MNYITAHLTLFPEHVLAPQGAPGILFILKHKLQRAVYRSGLLTDDPHYTWRRFIRQILQPDDIVIDISPVPGPLTEVFLQTFHTEGHLYCTAPVTAYQRSLQRRLTQHADITLLPFVQLNDACEPLQRLDYIQCDMNGYEMVVLERIKPLLQQHKPLVQVSTSLARHAEILHFFAALGFEAHHLERGRFTPYKVLLPEKKGSGDILFVPASRQLRMGRHIARFRYGLTCGDD